MSSIDGWVNSEARINHGAGLSYLVVEMSSAGRRRRVPIHGSFVGASDRRVKMVHFDALGGGDLQYLALEIEAAADGLRVEGRAHRKLERCRVRGLQRDQRWRQVVRSLVGRGSNGEVVYKGGRSPLVVLRHKVGLGHVNEALVQIGSEQNPGECGKEDGRRSTNTQILGDGRDNLR